MAEDKTMLDQLEPGAAVLVAAALLVQLLEQKARGEGVRYTIYWGDATRYEDPTGKRSGVTAYDAVIETEPLVLGKRR